MKAKSTVDPQKPSLTQPFIRISRISSNLRRETLSKSSNNASHDHDGQKIRVGLMLNLFRQLDQAGYELSQGP